MKSILLAASVLLSLNTFAQSANHESIIMSYGSSVTLPDGKTLTCPKPVQYKCVIKTSRPTFDAYGKIVYVGGTGIGYSEEEATKAAINDCDYKFNAASTCQGYAYKADCREL